MTLVNKNHKLVYQMEKVCRLFFPYEKIILTDTETTDNILIITALSEDGKIWVTLKTPEGEFSLTDRLIHEVQPLLDTQKKQIEIRMGRLIYLLLSQYLNFKPGWGIITGIRTVKLFEKAMEIFGNREEAESYLQKEYLVSQEKCDIAFQILQTQSVKTVEEKSFSLYLSIPFCPTRCSYCSFVSQSIKQVQKFIPEYLSCLQKEIIYTAEYTKRLGLYPETVYIGGGTPTVLTAEQLASLRDVIVNNFDLSHTTEYTLEAGRPDTITREKLEVFQSVDNFRISINPQSMIPAVLKAIGRSHTPEQISEAFALARDCGCYHINMDVIAGLPGDTVEGFSYTLQTLTKLNPESITIHTLAQKTASDMHRQSLHTCTDVEGMLDFSRNHLYTNSYSPYYLYKQSKTVGNHENIGWCKPGFMGWYNIRMMDDTQMIFGCGAGAVTKLFSSNPKSRIERVYNYKLPLEYVRNFNDVILRKQNVFSIR